MEPDRGRGARSWTRRHRSHVAGMVGDAKNDIAKGHPAGVARLGMQDTGT